MDQTMIAPPLSAITVNDIAVCEPRPLHRRPVHFPDMKCRRRESCLHINIQDKIEADKIKIAKESSEGCDDAQAQRTVPRDLFLSYFEGPLRKLIRGNRPVQTTSAAKQHVDLFSGG